MISQTSRYALRILGYLVDSQGSRVRGEQIASATGIPANYLSKILNQLRKQGVVDSRKGWGGGFELRRESLVLPIGKVLIIFDGVAIIDRQKCVFGLPQCDGDHPCPMHSHWERIGDLFSEMLTETTIGDLGLTPR